MKALAKRFTLADAVFPQTGLLRDAVLVVGFSCLTAILSQVSFWIGLVPITGQTFAVLLAGALLGSRRGAMSQLTYLAIGATGIPYWFALGGAPGIARFVGPTGGYLLGFVAAAFVVGWLTERGWDRRMWTTALSMVAGTVTIYLFGLLWLSYFVPQASLLNVGIYPFIPGDLLKIAIVSLALPSGWQLLRHFKRGF